MSWGLSILCGLACAVLALFGAGFVAERVTRWHRVSDREGARGYLVVFLALAGAVLGLLLGLAVARLLAARPEAGFPQAFGISAAAVLGLCAAALGLGRASADLPPRLDGALLTLEIEVRCPDTLRDDPARAPDAVGLTLRAVDPSTRVSRSSRRGELHLQDARREDGRWIVPGSVELYTARGERAAEVEIGNWRQGFLLPVPAHPGRDQLEWSPWLPRPRPGDPPWPAAAFAYRYRLVPEPEAAQPGAAPEPDPRDAYARQRLAELQALPADAALRTWLGYALGNDAPAVQEHARRAIAARPRLIEDLNGLLEGTACMEALRYLDEVMGAVPAELHPGVHAALGQVPGLLRRSFHDPSGVHDDTGAYDVRLALAVADKAGPHCPSCAEGVAELAHTFSEAPRVRRYARGNRLVEQKIREFEAERRIAAWQRARR